MTGQFEKIKLPLMKRVYPQLIANNIVSVQPLNGPSGLVYYLKNRYASNLNNEQIIPNPKKIRSINDPWEPAW